MRYYKLTTVENTWVAEEAEALNYFDAHGTEAKASVTYDLDKFDEHIQAVDVVGTLVDKQFAFMCGHNDRRLHMIDIQATITDRGDWYVDAEQAESIG
tara:strand:+ start:203 stop:496 length:294 start_codon:yes stop_codon:yes gene_type:complete